MKSNEDVARVVWNWRESGFSKEATRFKRRKSALIRFCIMFSIGTILFFPLHHVWIGGILYMLSLLILVGGFVIPPIYLAFDRVGWYLSITIGSLFTWVLMFLFFCIFFLPGRVLLSLLHKDPLQRARTSNTKSYWINKTSFSDKKRYQRLY